MDITNINSAIIHGSLTNEELNSIIDAVKFARAKLGRATMWTIKRGDKVSYTDKTGRKVIGEVIDIKVKNVIVLVGGTRWRVPANMLTKEEMV